MNDYRARIYENYATRFQDASEHFDSTAATRWGRAYAHYFRNWLPNASEARIVDLACGGGKLLHFFMERDYRNVQGVDLSPEQAALARQAGVAVEEASRTNS